MEFDFVDGHADTVGDANPNQDLSERRAMSVATWLAQQGIAPSRLEPSGRGLTEPIADNATAEGRALTRRVEIVALD